jgi:hypothetical protein
MKTIEYLKPESEVIKIALRSTILVGSAEGDTPGDGGSGAGIDE